MKWEWNQSRSYSPATRNKFKGVYLLGFELESEIMLSGELFIKYRLYKPSI